MRVLLLLISVFSISTTVHAEDAERLEPKNTYALIVGTLTWREKSLTRYSDEDRKDIALHKQLLAMGVPKANTVLLLDKEATRDAIDKALIKIAKQATKGSTLIIYYAGHGMTAGTEGVFACYDINTKRMKQTGWRHKNLADSIKQEFKGSNVLLFADCCFSGTLKNVGRELAKAKFQVACLTSASIDSASTGNWTFTMGLIDVLKGEPIADQDHDGHVSLAEASNEIGGAMKYFEHQRYGFGRFGMAPDFQIAESAKQQDKAKPLAPSVPMGFQRGQYVSAKTRNRWNVARLLGFEESSSKVYLQFQTYNDRPKKWVPLDQIRSTVEPNLPPAPPEPLADADALKKASLDGRFTELLHKIHVPTDFRIYGEFNDHGLWSGSSYGGQQNIKPGYWVYVYPNWYIWQTDEAMIAEPQALGIFLQQEIPQPANGLPGWDAKQMVGPPNTLRPGDNQTAWASTTEDDSKVWIELVYEAPMKATEIQIYETYNPGAVYQVSAFVDDKEIRIWKGKDPTTPDQRMGISKIPLKADLEEFSRIRIYLDSPRVAGWNEIDAVGVLDDRQKIHWAVDASASSNYSQPDKDVPFIDPFVTDKERLAESLTKVLDEIDMRKNAVRRMQDTIDAENDKIRQLYETLRTLKLKAAEPK